jgi:ComF family protein
MQALLDFVLPPACAGCGREGQLLCPPCQAPFRRRLDEPPGVPLGLPAHLPPGLAQLEWLVAYSGTCRMALHALKYGGIRDLAGPLGAALAQRWARAGRLGELLVPVPIHAARLRARGYDQAVLLAEAAGHGLGLPVVQALQRTQRTAAQHALGRGARAANVGQAFVLRAAAQARVAGREIVLVDDILTTGATLRACAAVLEAHGARAVAGLVVARER